MKTVKEKFKNYEEKYLQSKKDIDCIRRYRNGCQRILNEMNKNGYDDKDFYRKVGNEFYWAVKGVSK